MKKSNKLAMPVPNLPACSMRTSLACRSEIGFGRRITHCRGSSRRDFCVVALGASDAPRDYTRRYSAPVSGILAPQPMSNLRTVTKL